MPFDLSYCVPTRQVTPQSHSTPGGVPDEKELALPPTKRRRVRRPKRLVWFDQEIKLSTDEMRHNLSTGETTLFSRAEVCMQTRYVCVYVCAFFLAFSLVFCKESCSQRPAISAYKHFRFCFCLFFSPHLLLIPFCFTYIHTYSLKESFLSLCLEECCSVVSRE